jgi:hypothetical protein
MEESPLLAEDQRPKTKDQKNLKRFLALQQN